ncbi:hypothetical protein RCL_jg16218.t1 [Rhizophagus clarus]|uniref:Uncharacterized protein n=1 Tax=Rhizophagus clarus TaxID=94130 RepID=A0A8H3MFG5_9GLOM|nr:hypothetical protein RCL_jg16218.t1 [Rhizophagus clarus]
MKVSTSNFWTTNARKFQNKWKSTLVWKIDFSKHLKKQTFVGSFFGFGGDSLMKMGLSVETELFFLRSAVFLSGSLVETKLNTVTFGRIDNLRMINHQIR